MTTATRFKNTPLTLEQKWQIGEMLRQRQHYAAIAEALGISKTSVMRVRRASPIVRPMSAGTRPIDDQVRAALARLNSAFDMFERSQTKDTYDAWRESLRIYDDLRMEAKLTR